MKRVLVVYNPVSGRRNAVDFETELPRFLKAANYEWDWHETTPTPDQNLSPYFKKNYHRVIVVGGDGTITDVVRFMIQNEWTPPLAILSQGSGNVLARSLKIPRRNWKKALEFGLKTEPKAIDVMQVNGDHIALITAGRGFDAALMQDTTRQLKRKFGIAAYFWIVLKRVFFYRSHHFTVIIDGQRHEIRAKALITFNMLPWSETPWMKFILKQHLKPNDGRLDLIALNRLFLPRAYHGRCIEIHADREEPFELDGDAYAAKNLKIELLPESVEIAF